MSKKILLVLPTYNEEKILKENISKILNYLKNNLTNYHWKILIADNGSNDSTFQIAQQLLIHSFHLPQAGRGQALKKAWTDNQADLYIYMDIDLAVNLKALPGLINSHHDITIGSRYLPSSKVKRSLNRAIISKVYNLILKLTLKVDFKDAQCGFKAINHSVKEKILPQTKNTNWFFDTELLVLAQRQGFSIKEIPVEWREPRQRQSKVKIFATIYEYLKEIHTFRQRH